MSDRSGATVSVNFARPFPLFPLDGVVLLPYAVLRLFIFEPRYRQMVEHALDGSGQIAMAVFEGDQWKGEYHGRPALKRSVCIGRIAQHERLADGNYRIALQGVCRARIREEAAPSAPSEGDRLYRTARLDPVECGQPDEEALFLIRDALTSRLERAPLTELASVCALERELDERPIPTAALLELVTLSVLTDRGTQYRLLAEGDVHRRGRIVEEELDRLTRVLEFARRQHDPSSPRGVTWN
ncbi:MAG TPA: hypothetical protein DEB06_05690 [Phycisphaerales bacterium]|nr:hypothetical protein [Phycisphaerales bacterium]